MLSLTLLRNFSTHRGEKGAVGLCAAIETDSELPKVGQLLACGSPPVDIVGCIGLPCLVAGRVGHLVLRLGKREEEGEEGGKEEGELHIGWLICEVEELVGD